MTTHDHHHDHHEPLVIEDEQGNREGEDIVNALQSLLIKKGLLTAREVTMEIQNLEAPGTHLGAAMVARAWVDPEYKKRMLADGKDAAAELKIKIGEAKLQVVENTPTRHNLIVCTLCSCYPRSLLGQPPSWYISKAYRARGVREPAAVLAEFGLTLPPDVEICVHDSNADLRYLVLPERPPGTEGMSEVELAKLVTRDSMIGVAKALSPAELAKARAA